MSSAPAGSSVEIFDATGGHADCNQPPTEPPSPPEGCFDDILTAMRHRYLLRFDPDPPRPSWHRLRVRFRGAKRELSARPGYWT